MIITVQDGDLVTLDPDETSVLNWNWDDVLGSGVTVTTSTFTLTALNPSGATGITKDNPSILSASPYLSRYTQIRVIAGGASALGQLFELENKIVTSESPTQTKPRSIRLFVEQR